MIGKAVAVTKDYIRWAVAAMLVSALAFISLSLLVKKPFVSLTLVGAIAGGGLIGHYFRRQPPQREVKNVERL
jgi:hypothetical protein